MRNYRRFRAVLLLLTLLCGCAAEKAVTTVSLPEETNAAAEMQSTSALENTAAEPNTEEIDFHLELQRRVPEGINSITACMASDDIINNGSKQPTVADLEAQIQAGMSISLMDLASATHRERNAGKRKQSVLEQLKKQPVQERSHKTAPGKSAEKEL